MGRELDGKLVLVVEDHSATREGMAALLESAGATVETARSMEEALFILREAFSVGVPPEAIVCDILLPDVRGSALPAELHELNPDWRGPLVAVSAYPDCEEAARQAGFHDFLPKLMVTLLPLTLAHLFRLRPGMR
jgi:CheY-like chemotaxis protein